MGRQNHAAKDNNANRNEQHCLWKFAKEVGAKSVCKESEEDKERSNFKTENVRLVVGFDRSPSFFKKKRVYKCQSAMNSTQENKIAN